MIEANDMTRILAPNQPISLKQLRYHIAIANIGANERNSQLSQGKLKAEVTHQRTDNAALQFATLVKIASNDEQQLIAINNCTGVIDHQNTITITVERNTKIGMLGQYGSLQLTHMSRTTVIVDVQTIRLCQ